MIANQTTVLSEILPGRAYAYCEPGHPNMGVIIGERSVMLIDTQPTPASAAPILAAIRALTDKPISHIVLSHYHAVRTLGVAAFPEAHTIVASRNTHDLIVAQGDEDRVREIRQFARLFEGKASLPDGLTWPTLVFDGEVVIDLGDCPVRVFHPGRGHTRGDTVAWLERERTLFASDLVVVGVAPYAGDGYIRDWPRTVEVLKGLRPERMMPGQGYPVIGEAACLEAMNAMQGFMIDLAGRTAVHVDAPAPLGGFYPEVYDRMAERYGDLGMFEHCMPYDVSRAFDELSGHDDPLVWTRARDIALSDELKIALP